MLNLNVDTRVEEIIKAYGANAYGKTFVITGPSAGGIGATVATALAEAKPKQIVLAGRTLSKVQPILDEIAKVSPTTAASFVQLELSDLSSVRQAAAKIKSMVPDGIDGLYNNAGIMATREFKKTVEGVEFQLATNHLGHFLLSNLLLPEIARARGVVANATSRSWKLADPDYDNYNFDVSLGYVSMQYEDKVLEKSHEGKSYHGWIAYSRSKTANIHFSKAFAKRVARLGVSVFAVDPGMAMDSNLTSNSGVDNDWLGEGYRLAVERGNGKEPQQPIINLRQAAATPVLSLLDPSFRATQGAYLEECEICDKKLADYAKSEANAEKLWELSEELVGEKFSL